MAAKLHAVMRVNFVLKLGEHLRCFGVIVVLKNGLNKEDENWHFHYCTLLHLAVFRVAFGHLYKPS